MCSNSSIYLANYLNVRTSQQTSNPRAAQYAAIAATTAAHAAGSDGADGAAVHTTADPADADARADTPNDACPETETHAGPDDDATPDKAATTRHIPARIGVDIGERLDCR